MQDIFRAGLLPVELVRDVRLAVDRAARSQWDDLPRKRALDSLFEIQPEAPDLLNEELATAGGTLVRCEDAAHPRPVQQIHDKGLTSEGCHGIEIAVDVLQGGFRRDHLRDMAEMTGDTKKHLARKLTQQLADHLDRPAPVVQDAEVDAISAEAHNLDGQGAQC